MIKKQINLSFEDASEKIQNFLKQKDIKIFDIIDHQKEAEKVWLTMQKTQIIVYGSPKIWTLLMQKFPEISIELPLKIMLFQDKNGKTFVFYKSIKTLLNWYDMVEIAGIVIKIENLENAIIENLN